MGNKHSGSDRAIHNSRQSIPQENGGEGVFWLAVELKHLQPFAITVDCIFKNIHRCLCTIDTWLINWVKTLIWSKWLWETYTENIQFMKRVGQLRFPMHIYKAKTNGRVACGNLMHLPSCTNSCFPMISLSLRSHSQLKSAPEFQNRPGLVLSDYSSSIQFKPQMSENLQPRTNGLISHLWGAALVMR